MNDLLEVNSSSHFYDKKNAIGTDLLFNKNKISNEIASLSSMSSLSSPSSSIKSGSGGGNKLQIKKKMSVNDNEKKKFIKQEILSDDEDDEEDEDDEDDEDDEEDGEDEGDEDGEDDEEDEGDEDDEIRSNIGDNRIRNVKDELKEKREILYQLKRLKDKGYELPNNYDMKSDLLEMKQEYERIVRDRDIDSSIRFQRKMLMGFVTGTEYLNTRYDPFSIKLEGWSEQIHDNIQDYDDIFEELYEKYKSKGKKMAPELRLFISLTGSAFMFHLTARMFKESSIPGVEEVFKANPDLMKQFQNAAAKQFIYKNADIENNQQPQQQRKNNNQPGGGGIFGMIGNLFGGLTNTPQFNKPPALREQDRTSNDINSIINNVHSKISTHIDEDNKIETLSISDEEITSIIEDATDVNLLKKTVRRKNNRTLNI
jgi:hypothetical protein